MWVFGLVGGPVEGGLVGAESCALDGGVVWILVEECARHDVGAGAVVFVVLVIEDEGDGVVVDFDFAGCVGGAVIALTFVGGDVFAVDIDPDGERDAGDFDFPVAVKICWVLVVDVVLSAVDPGGEDCGVGIGVEEIGAGDDKVGDVAVFNSSLVVEVEDFGGIGGEHGECIGCGEASLDGGMEVVEEGFVVAEFAGGQGDGES